MTLIAKTMSKKQEIAKSCPCVCKNCSCTTNVQKGLPLLIPHPIRPVQQIKQATKNTKVSTPLPPSHSVLSFYRENFAPKLILK